MSLTGYTDEVPEWLQPYLAAAVRSGLTVGLPNQEVFGAAEPITGEEVSVTAAECPGSDRYTHRGCGGRDCPGLGGERLERRPEQRVCSGGGHSGNPGGSGSGTVPGSGISPDRTGITNKGRPKGRPKVHRSKNRAGPEWTGTAFFTHASRTGPRQCFECFPRSFFGCGDNIPGTGRQSPPAGQSGLVRNRTGRALRWSRSAAPHPPGWPPETWGTG